MSLGHDESCWVEIAVHLVNSSPELNGGQEQCTSTEWLRDFVDLHSMTGAKVTDADLPKVLSIRHQLLDALTQPSVEKAAPVLNQLACGVETQPRLRKHDGLDWHIDFHVEGATVPEKLIADSALGVMKHLAQFGMKRIKTCARPGCDRLLVDLTKNGSKRFCEGTNCAARTHAQAYRDRQKANKSD